MTKDTMIWQSLSMIIAGMSINDNLPDTKEEFEEKVLDSATNILDYPREDIREVLHNKNCTEFTEVLCELYKN